MHETSPIIGNPKGQRSACLFIIVMLGWINVVPNNINILIPIWSTLHVIKSKGMQEFVNDGSVGVARSLQVELLRLTLHSYTWMASTSVVGKVNHVPIFWSKWRDFTNVQATFKDGIELGIGTSYFLLLFFSNTFSKKEFQITIRPSILFMGNCVSWGIFIFVSMVELLELNFIQSHVIHVVVSFSIWLIPLKFIISLFVWLG